ncbi:tetratricopeptide repeat protein [Streptomyces violascens]|uniref:tetratricopeptide repeat protein n=1 Tax=Streptomyces violascens TaxID=67381 RepID=UPI0036523620
MTTLEALRDGLVIVPEHGHVLPVWDARGFHGEHVLFFDRHLDLKHVPLTDCAALAALRGRPDDLAAEGRRLPFREPGHGRYGLDDFLYPALAGNWLASVCWVVPGEAGHDPAKALLDALSLVPHVGHRVMETFTRKRWGACAELPVGSVACTGLTALGPEILDSVTAVDIDLDFFVDSDGEADHTVAAVLTALGSDPARYGSWTGSMSVSSGFVPPECGVILAGQLADALGMELKTPPAEAFTRHTDAAVPERGLAAAALGAPVDTDRLRRLWEEELAAFGAQGATLHAVLDAQSGRVDEAIAGVHRARGLGARASWPAYVCGLAAMRAGRHAEALELFALCTEDISDTLDAHAAVLEIICALRVGRPRKAVDRARRALHIIPLHRDIAGLLDRAGRRAGDRAAQHDAQQHAKALAEVWGGR